MALTLANPHGWRPPYGTLPDFGSPINRGLRGWYPLNEHYGTTAHDISGHQFNGSFVNVTISDWVYEPVVGRALNFGGTNQYVDIQHEVLGAGSSTMAAWFRFDDYTYDASRQQLIGIKDREDTSNTRACQIVYYGRTADSPTDSITGMLDRFSNENQVVQTATQVIKNNNWHHVAYIIKSGAPGTHEIYVDGMKHNSASVTGDIGDITSSRYITLGCEWHNGVYQQFLDGKMTDVRLWQRALSAHEINSLYVDPWAAYQQNDLALNLISAGGLSMPLAMHHRRLIGVA